MLFLEEVMLVAEQVLASGVLLVAEIQIVAGVLELLVH
jgi:hypothetical protein